MIEEPKMMTGRGVDEKTGQGSTETGGNPDTAESAREMVPAAEAPIETLESTAPTQLGATRYVLAGFFAAGMAIAFLVSNVLSGAWNRLADNAWVSRHAPILTRIAEDDRPTYTTVVGAAVGISSAVYAYRREDVRVWTGEVAAELAKVTWPSKKEVTNSTMIVIAATAFATVFLALLDRFWGFVTNLVYGS
jgi:preprotein translocase subunit SecE